MDVDEYIELHKLYVNANVSGLPSEAADVRRKSDSTTNLVKKLLSTREAEATARRKVSEFVTPSFSKKGVEFKAHDEEGLKEISEEIDKLTSEREQLEGVVGQLAARDVPFLYEIRLESHHVKEQIARLNADIILSMRKASYGARVPEDITKNTAVVANMRAREQDMPGLERSLEDAEERQRAYRELLSSVGL